MIGKEKLCESIDKFGFGHLTGIDLPGEASGIVKKPADISETDLATIAFGQTNTLNSIQYIAAFNAVANGGTWIQPHVMKEISHTDNDNNTISNVIFNNTSSFYKRISYIPSSIGTNNFEYTIYPSSNN